MKRYLMALALAGALGAQDKPAQEAPKLGSIAGMVTQAGSGAPMKDVEIWVNRNSPQPGHAGTDQQGQYVIRDVAPGQIRVSANAPDPSGRIGFGPNSTRLVTLVPGQDLTNVDFKLVIQGRITGKVVDQNKESVVGVAVFLVVREYSYGALRSVFAGASTTDDQGEYVLERVQPERAYAVLAQKHWRILPAMSDEPANPELRLSASVPTYHPNARSIDGAEMLVLRPGERRENVDIQLTRSASFCLDTKLGGTPGPRGIGFNIAETQPASGRSGQGGFYTAAPHGNSNPDGTARICDLHPGEYELSVSEYTSGGPAGATQFGSTIVTIGDRDVAGVRVALRPKIPVKGEVVFDGPAPEPPLTAKLGVDLQAITRTERASAQPTIPGEFDFGDGLVTDEFGLDISRVPASIYVKDVTYGDRSILYGTLQVGRAMGNAGLKIVLGRDGGTVSARVADKDGNPTADCTVVVMPATAPSEAVFAAMLITGKTDQSGAWSTATLAPGKYFALASNDTIDRSPEMISKLWKGRNRAEEVEIAPNGKASVTLTPKALE